MTPATLALLLIYTTPSHTASIWRTSSARDCPAALPTAPSRPGYHLVCARLQVPPGSASAVVAAYVQGRKDQKAADVDYEPPEKSRP